MMGEREVNQLTKKIINTVIAGVTLMLLTGIGTMTAFYYTTKVRQEYNDKEHAEFREMFKTVYHEVRDQDRRINKLEK